MKAGSYMNDASFGRFRGLVMIFVECDMDGESVEDVKVVEDGESLEQAGREVALRTAEVIGRRSCMPLEKALADKPSARPREFTACLAHLRSISHVTNGGIEL